MRLIWEIVLVNGDWGRKDKIIPTLAYSYADWLLDYIRAGHKYRLEFKRCNGAYMRPRIKWQ